MSVLKHANLTNEVVGAAIEVHRHLGPGLLEAVYEECLCFELANRGVALQRQVTVPLVYKGAPLATNLRVDVLVDQKVVVELKSVEKVLAVHEAQLLTYLRLLKCEVGLIINFNVPLLKQGIVRRVL